MSIDTSTQVSRSMPLVLKTENLDSHPHASWAMRHDATRYVAVIGTIKAC